MDREMTFRERRNYNALLIKADETAKKYGGHITVVTTPEEAASTPGIMACPSKHVRKPTVMKMDKITYTVDSKNGPKRVIKEERINQNGFAVIDEVLQNNADMVTGKSSLKLAEPELVYDAPAKASFTVVEKPDKARLINFAKSLLC